MSQEEHIPKKTSPIPARILLPSIWNEHKFPSVVHIKNWCMLNLSDASESTVKEFVATLVGVAITLKMNLTLDPAPRIENENESNVEESMMRIAKMYDDETGATLQ